MVRRTNQGDRMKRIIIATLLGFAALPAFASQSSLPFEQTQFDRTLPTLSEAPKSDSISAGFDDHTRYNPV
jgi:hypothetical protein